MADTEAVEALAVALCDEAGKFHRDVSAPSPCFSHDDLARRILASSWLLARDERIRADEREKLAAAWDEGVKCAGSFGPEDHWTHDMTPYSENPYRTARLAGEAEAQ